MKIQGKMSKKSFLSCVLIFYVLLFAAGIAYASEISLFDREGSPVAYIDTAEDYTIYLWNGTPVAYLADSKARNSLTIYGFNGKLLGWYVDGAIYDTDGGVSGFEKGCCPMYEPYTKYEPYKGYKQYKPYRQYREYEKYQPYFKRSWGRDLSMILRMGR